MSENSFDAGKAVGEIKKDRNLLMVAGGAVALLVGLFLPWVTTSISSVELYGFSTPASNSSFTPGLGEGFSIILLACAVVAVGAALNVMKQDKKNMAMLALGVAILALITTFNKMPDTGSFYGSSISTGFGYWVSLVGSIAMVVGTALRMKLTGGKTTKKTDSTEE